MRAGNGCPPSLECTPSRVGEGEPARRLRGGQNQHRRLAGTEDPVGHTPQEEPLESAVSVGAHDDEVDRLFLGVRDDVLVCSPFPEGCGDLETGLPELHRQTFQIAQASGRLGVEVVEPGLLGCLCKLPGIWWE